MTQETNTAVWLYFDVILLVTEIGTIVLLKDLSNINAKLNCNKSRRTCE